MPTWCRRPRTPIGPLPLITMLCSPWHPVAIGPVAGRSTMGFPPAVPSSDSRVVWKPRLRLLARRTCISLCRSSFGSLCLHSCDDCKLMTCSLVTTVARRCRGYDPASADWQPPTISRDEFVDQSCIVRYGERCIAPSGASSICRRSRYVSRRCLATHFQ